jgi:hypothetical protein
VLTVDGVDGAEIRGLTRYQLEGSEDLEITLRVWAEKSSMDAPSVDLNFELVAQDMPSLRAVAESRFMKPL